MSGLKAAQMHVWPFRAAKEPVQPLAALDSCFALWQKRFDYLAVYHPCFYLWRRGDNSTTNQTFIMRKKLILHSHKVNRFFWCTKRPPMHLCSLKSSCSIRTKENVIIKYSLISGLFVLFIYFYWFKKYALKMKSWCMPWMKYDATIFLHTRC